MLTTYYWTTLVQTWAGTTFAEAPGPTSIIERPGAIFTQRARPLYLDDHSWQVAYMLSIEPLVEQQSLIRDILIEVKSVIGQAGSFKAQSKYFETLLDLERGLEESVMNLDALTARDSCQETRQRRGVMAIGGHILRLLFGVLDWKIVQKIDKLENLTKGAVHAIENHVSILKDTHDAIVSQGALIDQAWEFLNNNVSVEIRLINQQIELDHLCNLIQSLIVNVHASIFRLQMRVQNWQSGRLSTSVLGKEFLLNITREIERQSKRNFHFDLITARISSIEFCQNRYEISMIISVPEDSSFVLYEVTKLPLFNRDSGKFLILDLPEFIAISNGRNVELSTQMFNEECYTFHTHYSCPQGVSPVRSNAQSCANSLLLSTDLDRTLELCDHRFDTLVHPTLQLVRGTNAVKYILPRPANCKLTCMHPGQRIEQLVTFSLHGSGVYQIPQNCSLNIDDLETFYSRHILYYNESLIIYNNTNAQNLLNRAKADAIQLETTKPTTTSVTFIDTGVNLITLIIACVVSSLVTFLASVLAMLPLYKRIYFASSVDPEFKRSLNL